MAGAAGHKNRLGNTEGTLNWLLVGNETPENRIETAISEAMRAFGRWRRGRGTSPAEGSESGHS